MVYLKYFLGCLLSIPLLPLMYVQGRRIRTTVPSLPAAREPKGSVSKGQGKPLRLIVIGESTMAGVGADTHDQAFAGALARQLNKTLNQPISWHVIARGGFTAQQVDRVLVPHLAESSADLIVIGLGGNDAFHLNTPWRWGRQVKQLIRHSRTHCPEAPIFFTNMPPVKTFPAFTSLIKFVIGNLVELLGEQLGQVVAVEEMVYYNEQVITQEDWIDRLGIDAAPEDFFSDGVHPSMLTYQAWGKDMANFITEEYRPTVVSTANKKGTLESE